MLPITYSARRQWSRQIYGSIRNAVSSGAFPLVLAGNCISCVGTAAGLGSPSPAMIWLDAHGDFNTPETSDSGFLDGMGLATAVGRCWGRLAATVSGFYPVPEKQVVLVGAREFDPMERTLLGNSDVHLIDSQRIRDQGLQVELESTLAKARTLSERAYLHIDLDVLDLGEARSTSSVSRGAEG
jgi:arginase